MQMMSVTSLNTKIKSLLEATFMHVTVEGEVSAVTYHTSGHLYFTIKDDKSALRCVMWRSNVAKTKFRIEKGMHVVIHGSLSVYTPRGEYQLQAVKIEPYGQGALALAFEQLKQKLKAKGYFDTSRKKPLPKFPKHIALVTAKESAALADMLRIVDKRWPLVKVSVVDTLVQGEAAVPAIVRALRIADTIGADVVVVGRGGGSKEDLWAFNEEAVADAIYAMQTPVVSAVGHEIDVLISDMVADVRAPTPSAAIETVLPDRYEVLLTLDEQRERLAIAVARFLQSREELLLRRKESLRYQAPQFRLVQMSETLEERLRVLRQRMAWVIEQKQQIYDHQRDALKYRKDVVLEEKTRRVQETIRLIEAHRPEKRVKKGWGQLVKDGKQIAAEMIEPGERFEIHTAQTVLQAECLSKKKLPYL